MDKEIGVVSNICTVYPFQLRIVNVPVKLDFRSKILLGLLKICFISGVPAVWPPDLLRAVRPRPQGLPPLPPAHPRHCKDLHVLKQESHYSVQKS